jgi:hypothetical protein
MKAIDADDALGAFSGFVSDLQKHPDTATIDSQPLFRLLIQRAPIRELKAWIEAIELRDGLTTMAPPPPRPALMAKFVSPIPTARANSS